MPASLSHFQALESQVHAHMGRVRERISNRYYSGRPFNPLSNDQVNTLIRRLGLPAPKKKTKTGKWSTSDNSIGYLRYEHPAIADIFEWREHQKVRDTFCRPLIGFLDSNGPDIQEIHPRLKVTNIPSRRPACEKPNMLQMPGRTDTGRQVRAGFVCRDDEEFGAADLSQIEPRLLAHLSQDPLLIQPFLDGVDAYVASASHTSGLPPDDITPEMRKAQKAVVLGGMYGQGPEGMLEQLWKQPNMQHWTLSMCKKEKRAYERTYEGLRAFKRRVVADLQKTGVVKDMWGMERRLAGIWSTRPHHRAEAERQALNHLIQGGAQGMIQNSMVWLHERVKAMRDEGLDVRWALQVHDEVIFRCGKGVWAELRPVVEEALTQHAGVELCVPVLAEGVSGQRWSDLK